MSILGGLIGGIGGLAGSIFGGKKASKAMKEVRNMTRRELEENENWRDRNYNEDQTQRATAQRILTRLNDQIKARNRAAAGSMAVTGGTEESVAAEKARNNEALANATAQIAAAGDARRDKVDDAYRAEKARLNQQLKNYEIGRAQAVTQAVGGVASTMGSLGTSIDDYMDADKDD